MKDFLTRVQSVREGEAREIPVIDLGAYRSGDAGALEATAAEIGDALENVGFFVLVDHGVSDDLIARSYAATRAFFDLPPEVKESVPRNDNNVGYVGMGKRVYRESSDLTKKDAKPKQAAESFFMKAELAPDHPDVLAGVRFRGSNLWPDEASAPGFRASMLEYTDAVKGLGLSLLPLYAVALDLPPDFFDEAFADPTYTLRLSHYPQQSALEANEQGLPPHTDTSFMTLLPYNPIQGLRIRRSDGVWIDAPNIPGSYVVNSGNMLRRWSNDRCMATPHEVVNESGAERYAMPFFMDCHWNYTMECLPTCHSEDNPPKYEPMTYLEYMTWYSKG